LSTVTFGTSSGTITTRTISYTLGSAIPYEDTGHFYEFVTLNCTWSTAKTAAEGRTLYGLQGYLATITSQGENDFIRQKLAADAWIGGSDEAQEGVWNWVSGPESGTQFSNGSSPVDGNFANWNAGEPNNCCAGEDYTEIYSTDGVGKWNDLGAANTLTGYVVEYGGMPSDPSPQITAERDVTVAAQTAPTVTTADVSDITTTTVSGGGNVTADGGDAVTARGVCWGTSANPTTSDSHTTDGDGMGSFTSRITGLNSNTLYHVRAYATNSVGTSYGDDVSFLTLPAPSSAPPLPAQPALATVTTAAVSGITTVTAECGGNVTADGGAEVTARGVCWGTSAGPITAGNHTTDGTGTGSFTSRLTGLSPDTAYHVRAYATNTAGIAYGSDVTFTTAALPPDTPGQKVPDLRVTVTATASDPDQPVQVGQEVPFLVTVENVGTGDANDVTVIVPIPAGMEFVAANVLSDGTAQLAPNQPLVVEDKVYINVGHVAAGQQVRIELVLRTTAAGQTSVSANAECDEQPELVLGTSAQVVAEDEYYVIQRQTPLLCGNAGALMSAITLLGLTGLKHSRRQTLR
jgi:uncharacterized repeat protein (TIGR01451 family)